MCLVDSGAGRSMIKTGVWRKLRQMGEAKKELRDGVRLRSLSGHLIPTVGVAEVRIVGIWCNFHVVDELQHDMLIGTDVMEKSGAVIVYSRTMITLNGVEHGWVGRDIAGAEVSGVVTETDYWREQFPMVFPVADAPLAPARVVEMEINTGNARPINQRPYRIPLTKMKLVEEELERMLKEDIIEPSCSAWASPLTMVPKKDGSVRICGDYRRLNEVTLKDAYPLPRIQDIFDQLGGAKVFTTIDLKSGYWQVRMQEGSKEKTAISTHRGLFQFKRMQFGLTNAPAVFQRMMNSVLAKYLGKSCLIYLDDVVIYSKEEKSHKVHVAEVLGALQQAGLVVKESKCNFGLEEVKLLGFVVCADGLKADPEKVSALRDMAPPTDKKGVRRVLGSANYYRQLMPNYADVVAPLTELTKKSVRFEWNEGCQRAWGELKQLLLECVVLKFPDPSKPYKLYTDASDYSIGAVLVQADEDGIDRPVHLISGRLNSAQRNYPTIEKEAYAMIYALIKLRPYLYGADFVVYTDHKPLKCLFKKEMKNSRIQRWSILLNDYQCEIQYMQGKSNVFADMLSRLRPEKEAVEPEEMSTAVVAAMEEEVPFEYYGIDREEVAKIHAEWPEHDKAEKGVEDFVLLGGLIHSLIAPRGRNIYPRLWLPVQWREQVIRAAHKDVGHMAMAKTLQRVQEHFRWPGMVSDVAQFIAKCPPCAINKVKREYPLPTPMPLPRAPGLMVAADLTGPFPESPDGNKYLLSIIDHCTGWVEVKPLPSKSAQGVYDFLVREYLPRFSAPEVFLTDNGLEFKNKLVMGHLEALGVEVRHSTPYHPQSNGMVERYHRTMKDMLKKMVNSRAADWEKYLGDVLLAYRTTVSGSTGFSPFFLTYGRHPNRPHTNLLYRQLGDEKTEVARRVDDLADAVQEAVRNRAISRQYNELRAIKRADAVLLEVGDRVLLRVNEPGPLDRKYDPGFLVTRIFGSTITVVGADEVKRTVNRDQVKLANKDLAWDEIRPRQTRTQRKREKQKLARHQRNLSTQNFDGDNNVSVGLKTGNGNVRGRITTENDTNALYFPNVNEMVDMEVEDDRILLDGSNALSVANPQNRKRPASGSADIILERRRAVCRKNPAASPPRGTKRQADELSDEGEPAVVTCTDRQTAAPDGVQCRTSTGAVKRAAATEEPGEVSTRVLRSHTRAGAKTRLITPYIPSVEEQQAAKRACIASVVVFLCDEDGSSGVHSQFGAHEQRHTVEDNCNS